MQLIVEIKNENVVDKVLVFLKQLQKEGVEIVNKDPLHPNESLKDDDIERHWREIGMGTDSVGTDDDRELYDAAWKFYREKHTD